LTDEPKLQQVITALKSDNAYHWLAIQKGIDVKVIAQWQGRRDGGKLILGTYSHVRNAHAEDMAKLLS
jgi:hypothetical protein